MNAREIFGIDESSLCAIRTCNIRANEKENWVLQECGCALPLCASHKSWMWKRVNSLVIRRTVAKYSKHLTCHVNTRRI